MIRSEHTANVLITTRTPRASWMTPAPVRAVRRSFFARLFNI